MADIDNTDFKSTNPKPKGRPRKQKANPAADLVRQKLDKLYSKEPDTVDEAVESINNPNRSKHQQFMYELSTSGKPLAVIQTEWHNYYVSLPDEEKHQVWKEFYEVSEKQNNNTIVDTETKAESPPKEESTNQVLTSRSDPTKTSEIKSSHKPRTVEEIKKQITSNVKVRGKLTRKQHLQSFGFGLAMGSTVLIILLFGFFNERFIAPFITPSRNVSATPIIIDPNSTTIDTSPQIIIPKINVQVPAVYDVPTIIEEDVQEGLERGIVHYATTSNPGEQGNAVFFGHSSSNILNRGKYKFAFVLLSWLEKGDTFYVQKDGTRYVYKIFEKRVVKPTDVGVLDPIEGKIATATLITCDPPGTNVNRLIVVGEQISPSPSTATASSAKTDETPAILASNSESLWHRLTGWITD